MFLIIVIIIIIIITIMVTMMNMMMIIPLFNDGNTPGLTKPVALDELAK